MARATLVFLLILPSFALGMKETLTEHFKKSSIRSELSKDNTFYIAISGFGFRERFLEINSPMRHITKILKRSDKPYLTLPHNEKVKNNIKIAPVFQCQYDRLVLFALSWGVNQAYKIAEIYAKYCGREVDAVYIFDGVQKPTGAFKQKFSARECFNVYQSRGPIRGGPIPSCQNLNLKKFCTRENLRGYPQFVPCHNMTYSEPARVLSKLLNQNGH